MGRIIQKNNGMTTIFTSGEDISLITGQPDTYVLGIDPNTGLYEKLNPDGVTVDLEKDSSGITGGTLSGTTLILDNSGGGNINISLSGLSTGGGISSNLYEVTYSGLTTHISNSTLSGGSYYMITDFQTCYDQPDFDYDNNPITSGNYKQGPVEPILVLATSTNTISNLAYQPLYPNDKITYDWTWNTTEVTGGVAFGRITERIDEFNNRTDYDHRNILFKRYKLYTIRPELSLNGTIELQNDGTVLGTNTSFTGLTIGDVIYMDGNGRFHEIISITDDTTMTVSGDTINSFGCCYNFYKAIEETNGSNGYFSYKQTNVKTSDFLEYTTFGDAINQNYAVNNFVGNYSNYYQNIDTGTFILPNNVFLEGGYQTNKFGDYCYNNTFGTDNSNNVWGDWCYENVSTNDIDDNIIGHGFYRNLINVNLTDNHIGNDFNDNKLLAENDENFEDNNIGNGFNNNTIYSRFYKNEILDDFNSNVIGDFGSLSYIEFYRNYIRNSFYNNTIKREFQNNQIGTNFQNNTTNGDFIGNTILNGFNNNTTGGYFRTNNIGNAFNGNIIYDDFYYNTTDYYFYSNLISNQFNNNNIGTYFNYNIPSNSNLFGWNDLTTVLSRTYDNFYNSIGSNQLGNRILGKEFVMSVISTSQYFKIKFNQWTAGGGGGFQYERQEIDSSGNNIGSSVIFTKTNNGSEVDVIVPGVVEITRGSQNGIYNVVTEGGWNSSVSPDNTEWNSIYTQSNNGERFGYNKIGNNFETNTIGSDFGYGGGQPYGNVINDGFQNNTIGQYMYNNVIGNYFTNNTIGDDFEDNQIQNYFIGNTIGTGFTSNQIGNYFGNNGSAGAMIQNNIFNDFKYNKIGNFFGNDTNFQTIGGGTNGDGGNIINDGFQYNEIGDNFIFNALDLSFTNNKIGNDFWFNIFGLYTNDNIIGNLFVSNSGGVFPTPIGDSFISNKLSNYSAFNVIGANFKNNEIGDFFGNSGIGLNNDIAADFNNNKIGNYFGNDGNNVNGGGNTITNGFYDNLIGTKFYGNTIDPLFYRNDIGNQFHNNTIQDIPGGAEFQNNEIGNKFNNNTTDGYFYGNQIGGGFNNNGVGSDFYSNVIGYGFNGNTIGTSFYTNTIDYYFQNNTIIQDFYKNNIEPYFGSNTIALNFNSNKIKTQISGINFTDFYGNITGFTYSNTGSTATDGLYLGVGQNSTTGIGVNATFNIEVSLGSVIGVTGNTQGKFYTVSDTLTILGAQISGVDVDDDVIITVTGINSLPSVYETYTCDIFERQGGTKRLSYYDSSDILTITNINE